MKFDNYLSKIKTNNFHKEKEKVYSQFSENINNINTHFIFFGKKDIGKYSQALHFVNRYSTIGLRYKKKIQIDNNKFIYNIYLSDVHYEIDFEYLTHNSKTFWFSIYNTILESTNVENKKKFIICKNFHKISNDLLNIFYNTLNTSNNLIFIFLCETICFFPENLIERCFIIRFSNNKVLQDETIIKKNSILSYHNEEMLKLIQCKTINYQKLRDTIYNMFIKQYCIYQLLWFLLENLNVNIKMFEDINRCCKLYNNNYRPIYHMERLILLIRKNINI